MRAAVREMPFRLGVREPVGAAVQRLARHEIEEIVARLRRAPDDDAVHEIRKSTKRLRALARLVRGQIGKRGFRRENHTFRDAARALSSTRDAAAVAATIERLRQGGGDGRAAALTPFRRAVRAKLRAVQADGHDRRAARSVTAAMRGARARVSRWRIRDDGWTALDPGFRRIYRNARAAWRAAEDEPSDERLHEWRKRVKDLRYALELLEPLWPKVMRGLADEVDDLADRLGDDHDLAMLRRFVLDPLVASDGGDPEPVLDAIDAARRDLQSRAWTHAERIFEAKPRRVARRVGRYWRAWCVETGQS